MSDKIDISPEMWVPHGIPAAEAVDFFGEKLFATEPNDKRAEERARVLTYLESRRI